ncbi:MAG: response regulator [Desulfobacterales bacterium]|nr:response regulator [Desulfobacterales bacterium]
MASVLIIDDQLCVRELLADELIAEGYGVHTLGNAESVREHLRFSRPDLVLLDLYLDGPDGWEVLHNIKGQNPDLPVIIFSAYDTYREDPRLSQADGYVIKSMVLDELKGKIADVLRRKSPSQEEFEDPELVEGVDAETQSPRLSLAHGF